MNPNPSWEAKDYVQAVYQALKKNKNYANKLRLKTRCVTIDYAGDFHLDVVPRVTSRGNHYICNRVDNKFEETDGTGYREWFNNKNRITNGNLKRAVRILKYLRDHKNNYTAKSILLTTLAGNAIRKSDEGTEAVSTVANTLVTVLSRTDDYLQQHQQMPDIRNPMLPTETFNRHWDQRKYENFRKRVHSHAQTAKQALAEGSAEESIKIWRTLFGESFGKSSNGNRGAGEGGPQGGGNRSGQISKSGSSGALASTGGFRLPEGRTRPVGSDRKNDRPAFRHCGASVIHGGTCAGRVRAGGRIRRAALEGACSSSALHLDRRNVYGNRYQARMAVSTA